MFLNSRKKLPFVASGLALALSCLPVNAEDKPAIDPAKPNTSSVSTGKEMTLTGKVVDLHQYMTGESDYRSSSIDRTTPTDRVTPTDRTKPDDREIKADDKDKHVMKRKNEIMGLITPTGLVLICFKEAPGVFATPRTDDAPRIDPAKPAPRNTDPAPRTDTPRSDTPRLDSSRTDASRTETDNARWVDKQVQVSGSMYERSGVKFLVVTKVTSSSDSTTTTPNTTPRPGTTPPTTPRP